MLLQGLTESESNDSLIGTPGHTLRLLPLPTQTQDRSLLRLDHTLEGASDFVLEGSGTRSTALLVIFLLTISED